MASHDRQQLSLSAMSPIERHHYLLRQGYRSDAVALQSAHRFLWEEEDASVGEAASWEVRLARQYYAQLFREYALADMTRYKEGAIGLRWRTEREVFDGKGQFQCGNKACTSDASLQSFEVTFAYVEHGASKQALVKLRVCPSCERKLHYRQYAEERHEHEHEHRQREGRARAKRKRHSDSWRRDAKSHRHHDEKRRSKQKWRRHHSRGPSHNRSSSSSRSHECPRDDPAPALGFSAPQQQGEDCKHERSLEVHRKEAQSETPNPDAFERYCKELLL